MPCGFFHAWDVFKGLEHPAKSGSISFSTTIPGDASLAGIPVRFERLISLISFIFRLKYYAAYESPKIRPRKDRSSLFRLVKLGRRALIRAVTFDHVNP